MFPLFIKPSSNPPSSKGQAFEYVTPPQILTALFTQSLKL